MAAIAAKWASIETGTVYHFCVPTLMVGFEISPKSSPATGTSSAHSGLPPSQ
jgi:hypothetical protein